MIKVAIVDDHKMLVDGLTSLINESGMAQVTAVAHSAEDCQIAIQGWDFDVLMLDVGLPGKSGLEFCKELKEKFPDIKILTLTTYSEYSIVKQMLDNGASGYLVKNATTEEVLQGIVAVANNQRFLSHEIDLLFKRAEKKAIWLSDRERELLRLVAEGLTNAEIGERIFLSPETIRGYRKNLLVKIGARNTIALVKMAIEEKLI